MNNKMVLYVLGGVLLVVGVLGFFMDPILGIFEVNMLHNVIHLVTGAAFVAAGMVGGATGLLLVRIFAVVYALVAVLGLVFWSEPMLLGLVEVNPADHILHVVLAAVFIWLGFFSGKNETPAMAGGMNQPPAGPQM